MTYHLHPCIDPKPTLHTMSRSYVHPGKPPGVRQGRHVHVSWDLSVAPGFRMDAIGAKSAAKPYSRDTKLGGCHSQAVYHVSMCFPESRARVFAWSLLIECISPTGAVG